MAGSFPITYDQMVSHLADQRCLSGQMMEDHLKDAKYVTAEKMREFIAWELKSEHNALEAPCHHATLMPSNPVTPTP